VADHWYTDAVVYSVDVARFADSNGDGIGDLPGLIERLDHIEALGATCLWLLPFYVSPRRDNGYDVVDHCAVDERLGTLDDVRRLVAELDRRDMRLVVDLVLNHTSDEHPWFTRALADAQAPERAYYVFRGEHEARPPFTCIFPGVERGPWEFEERGREFYLHHFYRYQPDLDPCHPEVRGSMERIVRFWGALGASGVRIDAASHIVDKTARFSDRDDDGHWVLRELAAAIRSGCRQGALMGEADVPVDELARYFGDGDEIQLLLSFVASQHLWLALARRDPAPLRRLVGSLPPTPPGARFANFLRNHDELDLGRLSDDERDEVLRAFAPEPEMRVYGNGIRRRAATMLAGDDDLLALAHVTTLALPGVPVLLYGDEIGLGDDLSQPERNAVRLAMQWTAEEGGGFSEASAELLQVPVRADGPFGYRRRNVRDAEADRGSLLHRVRAAVAARRAAPELRRGRCEVIDAGPVLALRYEHDGSVVVAAMNLSDREAALPELPAGGPPEVLLAGPAQDVADGPLQPAGYRWLRLPR
jgi:maltose alpha-D-glucosyltransferase/alpha-amylase